LRLSMNRLFVSYHKVIDRCRQCISRFRLQDRAISYQASALSKSTQRPLLKAEWLGAEG